MRRSHFNIGGRYVYLVFWYQCRREIDGAYVRCGVGKRATSYVAGEMEMRY